MYGLKFTCPYTALQLAVCSLFCCFKFEMQVKGPMRIQKVTQDLLLCYSHCTVLASTLKSGLWFHRGLETLTASSSELDHRKRPPEMSAGSWVGRFRGAGDCIAGSCIIYITYN